MVRVSRRKASRASGERERNGERCYSDRWPGKAPQQPDTSFRTEPLTKGAAVRVCGGRAFETEGWVRAKVLRWVHAYVCKE